MREDMCRCIEKSDPRKGTAFVFFCNSVCFERQKRCNAGALDRDSKLTLVLCASTGHTTGEDLAALADELSELVRFLIIDRALFLAEEADLLIVLALETFLGGTLAVFACFGRSGSCVLCGLFRHNRILFHVSVSL